MNLQIDTCPFCQSKLVYGESSVAGYFIECPRKGNDLNHKDNNDIWGWRDDHQDLIRITSISIIYGRYKFQWAINNVTKLNRFILSIDINNILLDINFLPQIPKNKNDIEHLLKTLLIYM